MRVGPFVVMSRDEYLKMRRDFHLLRNRTIELRRTDAALHGINPDLAAREELQWQDKNGLMTSHQDARKAANV